MCTAQKYTAKGAEIEPALALWAHGVCLFRGVSFFNSCSSGPILPIRLTKPLGSRGFACDMTQLS